MDGRINQQTLKRTNKNNILVKNILQSKYLIKIFIFSHSYGGPGTQTVSSKWGVGWDTYLASQRNFIVANIDVRGTGFQVQLGTFNILNKRCGIIPKLFMFLRKLT